MFLKILSKSDVTVLMWFNFFISKGLVPDSLLRMGVRNQGKQRLQMMENSNLKEEYQTFLKEASSGEIAVHTDDANNQHYEVDSEFFKYLSLIHI